MATDTAWIFISGIIAFGAVLLFTVAAYLVATVILNKKVFHSSFATTVVQCAMMLFAYLVQLYFDWYPYIRTADGVEVRIARDWFQAASLLAVACFVSFWSYAGKNHTRPFMVFATVASACFACTHYLPAHLFVAPWVFALASLCAGCAILYFSSPERASWGPTVMLLAYFVYGVLIGLAKALSWMMFEALNSAPRRNTSEIAFLAVDFGFGVVVVGVVMFVVAHTKIMDTLYRATSRSRK
jgi:hypothetical protein